MDEAFPEEDRRLFQVLIDHHLEPLEDYFALAGASDTFELNRWTQSFFEKYIGSIQMQMLEWEQIGLYPLFTLTPEPIDHPYVVRQYKIIGTRVEYLTQLVTPTQNQQFNNFTQKYSISQIYRPTNNIRLMFDEARTMTFTDKWLLNLKEVMVDQEIGDTYHQQSPKSYPSVDVDLELLDQLSKIYLPKTRKFHYKSLPTIYGLEGFMSSYLDLRLPGMENYLLILDNTTNPKLFVGGFLGQFPLTELYETPNALICHFQLPEPNFSKLNLNLFTHLLEVCTPYLWLLLEDTRQFRLQEQWVNGRWAKFEI